MPVYAARPAGLLAYRLFFAVCLAFFPVVALLGDWRTGLLYGGIISALVSIEVLGFMPRRYEVLADRVTIVFFLRRLHVPVADIAHVYKTHALVGLLLRGWPFVTTPWHSITGRLSLSPQRIVTGSCGRCRWR